MVESSFIVINTLIKLIAFYYHVLQVETKSFSIIKMYEN